MQLRRVVAKMHQLHFCTCALCNSMVECNMKRSRRFFHQNPRIESMEGFIRFVDRIPPDERGCKNWPHPHERKIITIGKEYFRVNRLSLIWKLGRNIRPGYFACHSCNNARCVNPEHIYEGTAFTNAQDRVISGYRHNPQRRKKRPADHWLEILRKRNRY